MTLPEKEPLNELTEIQNQLNNLVESKANTEKNSESNSNDKLKHSFHLQTTSSPQQLESQTDIRFPPVSTENCSMVRKKYICHYYYYYQ